jgi:hypothetical protein
MLLNELPHRPQQGLRHLGPQAHDAVTGNLPAADLPIPQLPGHTDRLRAFPITHAGCPSFPRTSSPHRRGHVKSRRGWAFRAVQA